ncbi:hypothetical protein AMTR_s00016p00244790 [Amborella trichopoda]|uniref:Uncharacterized protein n=1 Tax=Amborella trichopoda TaxID=13333 RepID=W1PGY3_AMBTC|nr:hypothetical protein AMTR_s00016p00244790 [Amborella trichopoda]
MVVQMDGQDASSGWRLNQGRKIPSEVCSVSWEQLPLESFICRPLALLSGKVVYGPAGPCKSLGI